MKNKMKKAIGNSGIFRKYSIDWENSIAYIPTHNSFGIFLNKTLDAKGKIKNELVIDLKELEYPISGKKVFKYVELTEKIYSNETKNAPDILFLLNEEFSHECVTNYSSIQREKNEIFLKMKKDDHGLYGIIMMYNPKILGKGKLNDINIIDIAPTALNIMGYDQPRSMDGTSFLEQIKTRKDSL
jgi:predicted AlkP superfamily phosphohydrolase/phosphomutase